jgi:four helix bundle protein
MIVKSYKDLLIWQRSMDFVEAIYRISEDIPSKEQFGLISQMRRASVSILSNIAEGYGRQSTGSYAQFLSVARGSLFELETQIEICIRLKYVQKSESVKLLTEIVEISKMISTIITKLH